MPTPVAPTGATTVVSSETFADKFCRYFGIPSDRFAAEMLRRTLYLHARPLLRLGSFDALAPDRDFVSSVGRLTRARDLKVEVREFQLDGRNRGFWRRDVRLRVSVRRMQRLFSDVWEQADRG